MHNLKAQQIVRVIRVEQATCFVVCAVLCEVINGEHRIVSEPKIIQIIPKKATLKLRGQKKSAETLFLLPGKNFSFRPSPYTIVSPYFEPLSIKQGQPVLAWRGPRPPTA